MKINLFFDLGYQQSFSIAMFTLVFLFSTIQPILLPFGCLFFLVKYFVDKYNIVYVYRSNYESDGIIRKQIVIFMLISVFIFSFIMIFIFAFMIPEDDDFQLAAYVMLLTTIILLFVIVSNQPWVASKSTMAE